MAGTLIKVLPPCRLPMVFKNFWRRFMRPFGQVWLGAAGGSCWYEEVVDHDIEQPLFQQQK